MSVALYSYGRYKEHIEEAGYKIRVATARGPLCTAGFIRGITEFMLDISDNPAAVHRLLNYVTDAIIKWLKAQVEVVGASIEGIFILDDVVGFLSRKNYLEFAHPYLKRIFEAFPQEWVKVYHNDANVEPFLEALCTTGLDVLNWSHKLDVSEVRRRVGGKICLMGNVAPLEIGTRGSPQEVKEAALDVLRKTGNRGSILSLGGGVSPGMPKANIAALLEAAQEFNRG
jgi:uroporphyrinogen decarboxylase